MGRGGSRGCRPHRNAHARAVSRGSVRTDTCPTACGAPVRGLIVMRDSVPPQPRVENTRAAEETLMSEALERDLGGVP